MCPSTYTYIQLYTLYGHMFYTNIVFCCIGVANKLFASLAHWLLLRLHARKGPSSTVLVMLPPGKLTELWKITMINGKIHYKWSFSIAMLNYQMLICVHLYLKPCQKLDRVGRLKQKKHQQKKLDHLGLILSMSFLHHYVQAPNFWVKEIQRDNLVNHRFSLIYKI